MNEPDALLAARHRFTASERWLALATVVSVSGSAYRRPGARLLITKQGETVAISAVGISNRMSSTERR